MSSSLKIVSLVLALNFPLSAWSHAHLLSNEFVVPRSTSAGLKKGPCGDVPRTATAKVWTGGSTITVKWEEVVQHPGRYEFYVSEANDGAFELVKTVVDTQDDKNTLPHQYSTTFTAPSLNCSACTFQMIQVMTENPANPTNYYSCADIQINTPVTPTPTPSATPSTTPTPTPSPSENCEPVKPGASK